MIAYPLLLEKILEALLKIIKHLSSLKNTKQRDLILQIIFMKMMDTLHQRISTIITQAGAIQK